MKIDTFNCNIENIFNQRNNDDQWYLIAFMNYEFKKAEKQWNIHNEKLYTIILRFKNWQYYFQDNKYFIRVIINYNNFYYFILTKKFNAKQIRWTEKLIAFDFIIKYCKEKLNFGNTLSKKFDIMKSDHSEKNNNNFLFILWHKFCNSKYQSKQV